MLIGLCGHSGAGKTTLAKQLIARYGHNWAIEQIGFVDPVLDMLKTLGVPEIMLDNKMQWDVSLEILSGKTIREAVDSLGKWGRDHISINMWINIAVRRARTMRNNGRIVIIDNVRFPNEFETVRSEGGTVIAINRPGITTYIEKETERYIPMLQPMCDHQFDNVLDIDHSAKAFCVLISSLMD